MTERSPFVSLIADRYLRAQRPEGALTWLRFATLLFLVTTILVFVGDRVIEHRMGSHLSQFLWDAHRAMRPIKYGVLITLTTVGLGVEVMLRFTVVPTVSTMGLFLGTGVLVTSLSVMSGFEQDLKSKIVGANAHVVITTPDRPFLNYETALAAVKQVPEVIGATPMVSGEVMLTSPSNVSGVILKGIDPRTVGEVTDLVKNTEQGSLDHLLHPERSSSPGLSAAAVLGVGEAKGQADGGAGQDGGAAPDGGTESSRSAKIGLDEKPATGQGTGIEEPPRKRQKIVPGIVLGKELAKNLRVFVGDEVHVISPQGDVGPTGMIPKARPFRVVAIFFSGMYEYDSKHAYMLIPEAQKFLGFDEEITDLVLKLKNPDDSEMLLPVLGERLVQAIPQGGFDIQDWKRLNVGLYAALRLEKIAMFIALCFIIAVAAASITSNGIMLVIEKRREIAMLKAMGASTMSIMKIFLRIGLSTGILGTVLGITAGVALSLAFHHFGLPLDTDVYYITKLPIPISAWQVISVGVASLLASLGATIYPVVLSASLRPVEGLK